MLARFMASWESENKPLHITPCFMTVRRRTWRWPHYCRQKDNFSLPGRPIDTSAVVKMASKQMQLSNSKDEGMGVSDGGVESQMEEETSFKLSTVKLRLTVTVRTRAVTDNRMDG
ncbi:hypothetical protein AVEN_94299-1 [Araneus ventricosus]|uniref:Uncharacterized protein n=1 Tax=Araneus ventricosus TaxID=182803 RepID=A0A4Y2I8Q0_ARAVE|nr:hypothetical protein AVEN_94299-1 [Araneus ventricosus]